MITRREADTEGLPPARARLRSPYDTDTRWAAQGDDVFCNGDKVHLTETCDTETGQARTGSGHHAGTLKRPNLITNVASTDATVPDTMMTAPLHQALAARDLLPAEHSLDSGYPWAELMLTARRDDGIALITPMLGDQSPQARAGAGDDRASVTIDFNAQHATCPQGHTSSSWNPLTPRGTDTVVISFANATPGPCPMREHRTTSQTRRRQLTVHPRDVHTVQHQARAVPDTTTWHAPYALRAGVEGTLHQALAVTGIPHARYRGPHKAHLQQVFSAVTLTMIRLDAWWNNHPLDRTRTSHLARLDLTLAA